APRRGGEVDAAGPDRAVPGPLFGPVGPRVLLDGPGHVLEQLGDADAAVAVAVALAAEAAEQAVGEQAVAPGLGRDGGLALVAGRDEEPAPAGEPLQQRRAEAQVAGGRAGVRRPVGHDLARVAAVEADDHGPGLDPLDPAGDVGHRHAAGHQVVGVG